MIKGTAARNLSFGKMRTLLQVVYTGMLGSLLALSAVVYYLIDRVEPIEGLPPSLLLALGGLLSLLTVGICTYLPHLLRPGAGAPVNVALKLRSLVFGQILFATGLEGAGLYWAILALLLKEPLCLFGPALALGLLIQQFPTTRRIEERLGSNERQVDAELARLAHLTSDSGERR